MIRAAFRLRDRNQVTLPAEVVAQLQLQPGDWLELTVSDQGRATLRPARLVTAGTPEAAAIEQASLDSVRAKRYTEFQTLDDFEKHVDALEDGDAIVKFHRAPEDFHVRLSEQHEKLKNATKTLAAVAAELDNLATKG
jgi:bifunctional DNA-binding transcriptional regulator/antitoxin component of YhaV-PrlF toxin-antitoxin module